MPTGSVQELNLREVVITPLSLEDIFKNLLEGNVLVISKYEQTRGNDILVKLAKSSEAEGDITYISFDVTPVSHKRRYWQPYTTSINALSLHDVFLYNDYLYSQEFKYIPEQVVRVSGQGNDRVYLIGKVYTNAQGEIYYSVVGLEGYYKQDELTPYK